MQQLLPLGNGSQFQPRELFTANMPPPPNCPPPPLPGLQGLQGLPQGLQEPLYAYPSSIYGTLPRGPPRPVERPSMASIFHEEDDEASDEASNEADASLSQEDFNNNQARLAVINYATFRQNLSAEAAAAAFKRAEIAAHLARHWSDDDLSQMPTLDVSEVNIRTSSPSPTASRRSNSPGKNVRFLEQDERSLNELETSPRHRILKPNFVAVAASNLINGVPSAKKRKAPSPPDSGSEAVINPEDDKNVEDIEASETSDENLREHEALGARLSASLRQTFKLN